MSSAKSKGLFVEFNPFSTLVAITSSLQPPFRIELLKDLPPLPEKERLKELFTELLGTKGRVYHPALCGAYPASRFLRRSTLESPAKAKEPNFFAELLSTQFRIDTEKNSVAILNAGDGSPLDFAKGLQTQKDLLFCGALTEELAAVQAALVDFSIYPESLQLGSMAALGGLMDYTRWKKLRQPTLVLEVTAEASNLYIFSEQMLDVCRPIPYGLNSMFPLIQQELGLKDEESARKLFYSNTFDFTEMGSTLMRKMLKELQASTGFYEVQTGQTIGQLYLTLLPKNLNWIQQVLSKALGVKALNPDVAGWLRERQITASDAVQLENLENRWFGLFSLMGDFLPAKDGEKKS